MSVRRTWKWNNQNKGEEENADKENKREEELERQKGTIERELLYTLYIKLSIGNKKMTGENRVKYKLWNTK